MSKKEIIKEIKERIIEPFYCFPNPTSIELKDKDVNLIEELIDLYIKLQYELEVEKIDNKYNQEERDEETIPRYKIIELLKEIQEEKDKATKHILKKDYHLAENGAISQELGWIEGKIQEILEK